MALYNTFHRYRRCSPTACSGMYATPESFRPNQSPLAANLPAPGSHMCRKANVARTKQTFAATGTNDLSAAKCLLVDRFQPHGSRAEYGPLRIRHANSDSRMPGVHQPLSVEAEQSPPTKIGFS